MPRADVVVIGAGLAGLTAALRLAEAGAAVTLVAKGHASTHWGAGGIDVAAPQGAHTPAQGVALLGANAEHPYAFLGQDAAPAVAWLTDRLAASGLPYAGSLETPIRRVPTAIGGTRRVAIVPEAQAAALRPWERDEVLVIAGPAGYKDFWPAAIADSLARESVWHGADRPAHVRGVTVDLPGLRDRRNLNALELAQRFDDPARRADDLDRIARAVKKAAGGRAGRVGLPAVIGLDGHADAWADARARLPLEPFEIPLVPPSVPGMRLWRALRERIRAAGGRIQVGENVHRIEVERRRVIAVEMEAATRVHRIRTDAVILATGGIAGGGLVATGDGRVVEPLLGLSVDAPDFDAWLLREGLDPAGHPIEAAGIRTDPRLHPVDPSTGKPAIANVLVAGALLAGQRALRERSGDGIAVTSGWRAAGELSRETKRTPVGRVPAASRSAS
ncbi:MAG TPA: anaerobic glycerol-3-phosphate dehydrogenase subunit GlpB [Candidatus Limnocylindrales bacterium]|nr:anaerobic glycerol-3-phosphate dehydrogenase subunit GlpB [Candidatus Limnocylindrales bacterium]